ncbi:hypothetical protein YB2330_003027 [Saitoella coloradoensis]
MSVIGRMGPAFSHIPAESVDRSRANAPNTSLAPSLFDSSGSATRSPYPSTHTPDTQLKPDQILKRNKSIVHLYLEWWNSKVDNDDILLDVIHPSHRFHHANFSEVEAGIGPNYVKHIRNYYHSHYQEARITATSTLAEDDLVMVISALKGIQHSTAEDGRSIQRQVTLRLAHRYRLRDGFIIESELLADWFEFFKTPWVKTGMASDLPSTLTNVGEDAKLYARIGPAAGTVRNEEVARAKESESEEEGQKTPTPERSGGEGGGGSDGAQPTRKSISLQDIIWTT